MDFIQGFDEAKLIGSAKATIAMNQQSSQNHGGCSGPGYEKHFRIEAASIPRELHLDWAIALNLVREIIDVAGGGSRTRSIGPLRPHNIERDDQAFSVVERQRLVPHS
jgi:hypothetical protein